MKAGAIDLAHRSGSPIGIKSIVSSPERGPGESPQKR
jgi:hypothetical protein